jgi:hypothetical protein
METCTEPQGPPGPEPGGPERAAERTQPWSGWVERWRTLQESVDSEWSAAYEAFTTPGAEATRKWLGWALYRLATRVNPEIRD